MLVGEYGVISRFFLFLLLLLVLAWFRIFEIFGSNSSLPIIGFEDVRVLRAWPHATDIFVRVSLLPGVSVLLMHLLIHLFSYMHIVRLLISIFVRVNFIDILVSFGRVLQVMKHAKPRIC